MHARVKWPLWFAVAVCSLCAITSWRGVAGAEPKFDSPNATFNTARQAMVRGEYDGFCQCFSDDGLSLLAGSMRLTSGFLELAGKQQGADARSVKLAKGLEDINRRYLKPGPAESVNLNLSAPEAELRAAVGKLAESITDRAGYTSAMFALLQANSDVPGKPQPLADAKLQDLKVDGAAAIGTVDGTFIGGEKSKTPIKFRNVKGAWKIDQLGEYGASTESSDPPRQAGRTRSQPARTPATGRATSIHRAASAGNLAQLREFLKQGTDVDLRHETLGGTALHFAADAGQDEIIRELLKHKADFEAGDLRGYTPLMRAADQGHTKTVKLLLDAGANIDAKGEVGDWTAVCLAINAKHRETAQLLVDRGAQFPEVLAEPMRRLAGGLKVRLPASPQPRVEPPRTARKPQQPKQPKQKAAALPALPDAGELKPIDQPDDEGFSKLHRAVMGRKIEQIRQLLDEGADVDVRHRAFLGTPLQYAASTGGLDVAALLIERGAAVDAADSSGRTPLMWAAWKGHTDIVKALLDADADIRRASRNNWTALHFAADKGHLETARLLVEHGASLTAKSSDGKTPLDMNPSIAPPG